MGKMKFIKFSWQHKPIYCIKNSHILFQTSGSCTPVVTWTNMELHRLLQDKIHLTFASILQGGQMRTLINLKIFSLHLDTNTGKRYTKKNINEQTKNHQMDTEMSNSAMPKLKNFLSILSHHFWSTPQSWIHDEFFCGNKWKIQKKYKMLIYGTNQQTPCLDLWDEYHMMQIYHEFTPTTWLYQQLQVS